MRACEFITEVKKGVLHPEQAATMPRAHKFAGTADRIYDLNRAMMAVASSDGKNFPHHDPTEESWIGRNNMAAPFSEQEHDMLHHAYRAIGTEISSIVDEPGVEPDTVNKTSPVKGFRGYPR
jgi:hypothetical protein